MFDEEEKREDTVTTIGEPLGTDFAALFGPGPGIAADVNAIVNTLFGHIRTDLQAGGTGLGVYDPSPEDRVFGLQVTENDDGSFTYTAEVDGWFDTALPGEEPNGQIDSWELQLDRGQQGTTTNGYGPDRAEAFDLLGTFTPLPDINEWG